MNLIHKALTLLAVGSMLTAQAMAPACTPASSQPTLTVGIDLSAGLIPYSSLTGTTGKTAGADVDVACAVFKELAAGTLNFVNIPYDQLPTALANGTIQIAMGLSAQTSSSPAIPGGAVPTVSFVVYNNDNLGIIMTPSSLATLQMAAGVPITSANIIGFMSLHGTTVGWISSPVLPTSTTPPFRREGLVLVQSGIPGGNIDTFTSLGSALTALSMGTVNAIFVNNATANAAVAANTSALVAFNNVAVTLTPATTSQGLAIGIAPSCCQLYANVAQAIANIAADGTLAAINKTWNTDGTPSPLPSLTPTACAGVAASLPQRNGLAQFVFDKNCPCANITTVTTPAA